MNTARPYERGEVPIASHARSDAQVRWRRRLPWGLGEQRLAGKREREGTSLSCRRRWRERVGRDKNKRRFPLQHSPLRPHRLEHTRHGHTPVLLPPHSAVVAKGRAPLAPPDCGCGCSSCRHFRVRSGAGPDDRVPDPQLRRERRETEDGGDQQPHRPNPGTQTVKPLSPCSLSNRGHATTMAWTAGHVVVCPFKPSSGPQRVPVVLIIPPGWTWPTTHLSLPPHTIPPPFAMFTATESLELCPWLVKPHKFNKSGVKVSLIR